MEGLVCWDLQECAILHTEIPLIWPSLYPAVLGPTGDERHAAALEGKDHEYQVIGAKSKTAGHFIGGG